MVRKILNWSEKQTEIQLLPLAAVNGARVLAKVRVADALEIANSGITSEEYSYALKAHFDFLICDKNDMPLFAVEFDGPTHGTPRQIRNDLLKDSLCRKLGLPVLRANWNHLTKRFRRTTPLSWLVETWFLSRAFDDAQEAGHVPFEEGFDPSSIIMTPEDRNRPSPFPFDLAVEARAEMKALHKAGKIADPAASWHVGRDNQEALHGFACVRINEDSGVKVTSGMRAQLLSRDLLPLLLGDILVCELLEHLRAVLSEGGGAEPLTTMYRQARDHMKRYWPVASFAYGGNPCLATWEQRAAARIG
jgi:hypothetical protein